MEERKEKKKGNEERDATKIENGTGFQSLHEIHKSGRDPPSDPPLPADLTPKACLGGKVISLCWCK
ncbi:hypothetical protein EYF80_012018 [Liparis tanakae]|uniref:Uncharacterized protein n=1 Tax=Liparis tanakae TaxID=230148 RepID=A0A4Z2IIA7_9TELE|nr:hypothetical protein EYF80_012018 [Liparis tanakae]